MSMYIFSIFSNEHMDYVHPSFGRFMSVESMVNAMIESLNDVMADAAKHDGGNSAAGTRVRKAMQELKNAAQDVRIKVQSDKNSR
ncbi:MAG: hypothetical protein ACPHK2_01270 [Candidatus Poseidoniaceae archaeon]